MMLLFGIMLLSGCYHSKTYHYYVLHPKELWLAVQQCKRSSPFTVSENNHCVTVYHAALVIRSLIIEFANDQQAFGRKLLAAEEKASQLQTQLTKANNAKIAEQLTKVQLQITTRLVVLKLVTTR